jgi:type I restriction enzyme S subunit
MDYLSVPREVTLSEVRDRDAVWSPSMFRRIIIPNGNVKRVGDLLVCSKPFEKGVEPGSINYLRRSTHFLIRTKALQAHSYLLYPKGDAIAPISPKVFENLSLADGDILMSKDSNVGECAMVDGDRWRNHMTSGGIVRLHPAADRYYLFAFLKHPLFKTQLLTMSPRGATIMHAKTLWLDCLIPFPNQRDGERVINYVSALMQAIVEKEKAIRERSDSIHNLIQTELEENQTRRQF